MTASAAGSGGAVCPSTAAGGAVIFFVYGYAGFWVWVLLCPSTSAAGAVTVGAATAMPAGAGGPPAPATVHGVPGVPGVRGPVIRLGLTPLLRFQIWPPRVLMRPLDLPRL